MKNLWKTTAKEKQLQFKNQLNLTENGTFKGISYGHILSDKDAGLGANFYCYNNTAEWQELQNWAEKDKGKKIEFLGTGLKNMLRSEHIPYNLFFPLEKLRKSNPKLLNTFLEQLFDNNIKVDEVLQIKIEFASSLHKNELLDDNTSFDAYIEYLDGEKRGGLGIEVKYTEKSYPYGKTEYKRMLGLQKGEYLALTARCKYYISNINENLISKKLKQAWRNHLLGIKLVETAKSDLTQFHSVHLYPKGNTYQTDVCEKYSACLSDHYKNTFVPITFEKFIEVAENTLGKNEYIKSIDWIAYLKNRY